MGKCKNCGSTLTCGCQVRALPNGVIGCTKCANPTAKALRRARKPNTNTDAPIINNASLNKDA
jgi:hypothetical protein